MVFSLFFFQNVSDYVIYTVNATDADIGVNQELKFSLDNYNNLFYIDASSGQVSRLTTVTLDYEKTTLYDVCFEIYLLKAYFCLWLGHF